MPDINPDNLSSTALDIIVYFGVFVFTSLVGIIVWLAKKLDKRMEEIARNQVRQFDDIIRIGKDLESVMTDMKSMKHDVKEISEIKLRIERLHQQVSRHDELSSDNKTLLASHEKAINEMKLLMARYLQVNFTNEEPHKKQG